jgi:hypothetical protein
MVKTRRISALVGTLALTGVCLLGQIRPAGAREQADSAKPAEGVASGDIQQHSQSSQVLPGGQATDVPGGLIPAVGTVQSTKSKSELEVAGVALEFTRTTAAFAAAGVVALQIATRTGPTFMYGPGASGLGYYSVSGAQTVAARAGGTPATGTTPSRTRRPSRRYREHGSGRSVRLEKPWLRQFD